jgi:signal transduction histidine kinase
VLLLPLATKCASGHPSWTRVSELVRSLGSECQQVKVLGGRCLAGLGTAPAGMEHCQVVPADWCERATATGPQSAADSLALLRVTFARLVLEWRLESQRTRLNAILANAYRRLTDYAMVQELVSSLTETLAEEKVVEKVFDIFTSMLAPSAMVFATIDEGKVERVWARPSAAAEDPDARKRLVEFKRAYAWTDDGRGFRLGIRHRSRPLGAIEVMGIAPLEYREHYLDLALIVTRVTGLALSNARLYRDLKGPNRPSLEFAEDLRDALLARKRAEERQAQLLRQVEAANQELADFAYVVSHDLKAPLRAIDSLARWLVKDYSERLDDEGREQLNLLVSRADRMRQLIDGILQYSLAGRMREESGPVDLARLVPEVIESLAPPAHIRITVAEGLPVVTGHRVRLEQVFQNLLSNAVKYMDKPRGEIGVGWSEEPGTANWRFFVADNGPGIEEKDFERVFQLFQTLRPRDEADSTGVGLSVVKKIVEMYGGRVGVESVVGKGSTFYFTLPRMGASGA